MLLIITHFHLIGALSSASFAGAGPMTFQRPRQLSVAANQSGVLPFLRRVAILHSHKALTLAALYFSMRHVDIFGGASTKRPIRCIAWVKCPYRVAGKASALRAGKRASG